MALTDDVTAVSDASDAITEDYVAFQKNYDALPANIKSHCQMIGLGITQLGKHIGSLQSAVTALKADAGS